MTAAVIVLSVVCGILLTMLIGASLVICDYRREREKREERERIEARMPHPAPKPDTYDARDFDRHLEKIEKMLPDAAKECGVVPPKFDEPKPRRNGKYKIYISFWFNGGRPACFHDLAEFYRTEGVRKCDFSPSCRMEEEKRLEFIARRIGVHYRDKGAFVRGVIITRRGKQYHFDHFPYPAGVQK